MDRRRLLRRFEQVGDWLVWCDTGECSGPWWTSPMARRGGQQASSMRCFLEPHGQQEPYSTMFPTLEFRPGTGSEDRRYEALVTALRARCLAGRSRRLAAKPISRRGSRNATVVDDPCARAHKWKAWRYSDEREAVVGNRLTGRQAVKWCCATLCPWAWWHRRGTRGSGGRRRIQRGQQGIDSQQDPRQRFRSPDSMTSTTMIPARRMGGAGTRSAPRAGLRQSGVRN